MSLYRLSEYETLTASNLKAGNFAIFRFEIKRSEGCEVSQKHVESGDVNNSLRVQQRRSHQADAQSKDGQRLID